jgi:hypothetical protein
VSRTATPGSPPITVRSWPFGALSRRRLLELVLQTSPPKDGWQRSALEKACGVSVGTLDAHLDALVSLGLLTHKDGRFFKPAPMPPLARFLRGVLRETTNAPDAPAPTLPRRKYTRRG